MRHLAPLILFIIMSCGCNNNDVKYETMLNRADSIMDVSPETSLALLDSCKELLPHFSRAMKMRYYMYRVKAENKGYVSLAEDSTFDIMEKVVDYYENHGTPNEQMLSLYLMGCVYRDMGEVPVAFQYYQDAVEKADTLDKKCDLKTLLAIHSQKAELLYSQNSCELALEEYSKAAKYASAVGDTLKHINNKYEQPAFIYIQLGDYDRAMDMSLKAAELYKKFGKRHSAFAYSTVITVLLKKGEFAKAKPYMDFYEKYSGDWLSDNTASSGSEVYYYDKALYYVGVGLTDSAEYFLRKEMETGNRMEASDGLFRLYDKLNIKDSVSKYARMRDALSDSLYNGMATENLQRMQSMYNYARNQRAANEKEKKIRSRNAWLGITCFVCIILALGIYVIHDKKKRELKCVTDKYAANIILLNNNKAE